MSESKGHKQVAVVNHYGRTVKVDEGMVDILKLFWDRNINTCLSCEDNNGTIWINFWLHDFKKFARQATTAQDKSLFHFLYECDREILFDNDDDYDEVDYSVSLRFDKELKDEFLSCWDRSFGNKKIKK